ncbi:MAG: oxygen-dependent coproporphyrinogen oxidase [Bacteroidetes bacterium]|nr:oxygen-dependent coproporphyrinogen oxidase [Bacteroidota bacterium]
MKREEFVSWISQLQDQICRRIEQVDGHAQFREDLWERHGGGGGTTRVIAGGNVFEKGGVNISEVYGDMTDGIRTQLKIDGARFFACGLSLVIHPHSPMVPTVHANYRYFEVYNEAGAVTDCWFGGGADLTPCYLFDEDAVHFHLVHKSSCDQFDPVWYPLFKKQCDDYFVNTHRGNERRGIGGIFYDHLRPSAALQAGTLLQFAQSNGKAFIDAYLPIVELRMRLTYTDAQKHWQLIRRGRYVEFNLIHDRGTIFGLKSNGRTESILMSLPPEVRFEYDYQPLPGGEEARLQQILLSPKDWI